MSSLLRLHDIVPLTFANGPGARACVWLQGCSLACPACFNPETHDFGGGRECSPEQLAEEIILLQGIVGVTVSGGEPLQQSKALLEFLSSIKENSNLSVILFSGFSRREISKMDCYSRLSSLADAVIAGRYVQELRQATGLLGSANQEIILFSARYTPDAFPKVPAGAVLTGVDGTITLSGVDPMQIIP